MIAFLRRVYAWLLAAEQDRPVAPADGWAVADVESFHADFARSTHAGFVESPDDWAARTGNAAPARIITRLPEETP